MLNILEKIGLSTTYLALDINPGYLAKTISSLRDHHSVVKIRGAWGTFLDTPALVESIRGPRVFLFLGTVLFRYSFEATLDGLKKWSTMMTDDDIMFVGTDTHVDQFKHRDKVWKSYHPQENHHWDELWENGFQRANEVVKEQWFRSDDWDVDAVLEMNEGVYQHRSFLLAKRDVTLGSSGVTFAKGEELGWFDAHKFDAAAIDRLFAEADLEVVESWNLEGSEMRK